MNEKSLKLSIIDGFLYSMMVGLGESYLPAYVLSIGMSEVLAGLIVTLPMVSGAFMQLFSPKALQKIGNHKYWVIISALVQAFTFIPLIYLSFTHKENFLLLFLILTVYWATGFAAGPAWNYWMGRLVNIEQGNEYFAKRTKVTQIGLLCGLIVGGVFLKYKISFVPFASVFTLFFIFAFIMRLLSTLILSYQHFDHSWGKDNILGVRKSFQLFWKNVSKRNLFISIFLFQACVFISGPFVAPFILAQLHLTYYEYMTSLVMFILGKIFCLSILEKYKKNYHPYQIFLLGIFLVSPWPFFWSLVRNPWSVSLLQFISGISWAILEMGLSIIFFKDLKNEEKVPVITVYNLLNSIAIVVGTAIGSNFLLLIGENLSSYVLLFVIATGLRFIFSYLLLRTTQEARN